MEKGQKKKSKKVNLAVKVSKTKRQSKGVKARNTVSLAGKKKNENNKEIPAVSPPPRIISEKIESDKRLIMWSGVTFFMLLIGFLWIFQIKQSIKKVELESSSDDSMIELRTAAESISEAIAQMKNDISTLNDFSETENESENLDAPVVAGEEALKEEADTDEVASSTEEFGAEEFKAASSLPFPEAEDVETGTSTIKN